MNELVHQIYYLLGIIATLIGACVVVYKASQRLPFSNKERLDKQQEQLHQLDKLHEVSSTEIEQFKAAQEELRGDMKAMRSELHQIAKNTAEMAAYFKGKSDAKG